MHLNRLWIAAAAALCFSAAPAVAQGRGHGNGHGNNGNGHGNSAKSHGRDDDGDVYSAQTRGHGRQDDGDVYNGRDDGRSGGFVPPGIERQAREGRVPPGLAKKGGLPPGQAKKIYSTRQGASVLGQILGQNGYPVIRTRTYGSSRYVYYRRPDGSLARAVVSPGSDQLAFRNVPAQILQAVLARLY